jgi:hypothetical protein
MSEGENLCRAFFEQHTQNPKKVELLQQSGAAYLWENQSASKYSPGPVQSHERVLRLIINPHHVDPETGDLKPSAVTDAKDKGCSVERLELTTAEESVMAARKLAQSKNEANPNSAPRSICSVSALSVGEIRRIKVGENTQAFCVFDTALEHNPAHADVCQIVSKGQEARSARSQLLELADKGLQFVA